MKKSTILKMTAALAILFLGYANSWGQSPASITDGSSTLRQFGVNAAGTPVATEYIDSLTVGAANVKYLVYPDSIISPTYNFSVSHTANLNSHFVWSLAPGVTSIDTTVAGYASNYALITFPGATGDHTLSVYEKANTGSCTASARSYTVRLIAAPTVTGTSFSALACPTGVPPYSIAGPTATLTMTSSVSGAKGVVVTYNLTGPAGFTALMAQTANLGNGNQINLTGATLNQPGTYTLRVLTITDRISQKAGVTTTVNTDYTFVLNRAPITGPIYHLPNN
jgi:hypothetical protein